MPAKSVAEFRAAYGIFAVCSLLALVLGYQLPTTNTWFGTPSATEFLTSEDSSVREVVGTNDENGDQWLGFLSQSTATSNPELANLELLWRNNHGAQALVTLATGPALGPATLTDIPGGGVFVVWEARRDPTIESDRVLRGRRATLKPLSAGNFRIELGSVEDIPTASINPLQPHLARLADGSLGLVWQARTDNYYQAQFAHRAFNGQWSTPRAVSHITNGDVWRSRIAAAKDGRVLVTYDSFDTHGTYSFDVWLAVASHPGAAFKQQLIAGGPTYQGYPDLQVDLQGRTWIVYEEARSFGQGGPLRSFRRTNLAMVDVHGKLAHAILPAFMQEEVRGDFPQLHVSAQGLSLTRRIPLNDYKPRNANMLAFYATWGTSLVRFDGDGIGREELLADTDGGNENDGVVLPTAQSLEVFFATDTRSKSFAQRFSFDSVLENYWRLAHRSVAPAEGFPKSEPGPAASLAQPWGQGPGNTKPAEDRPTVLYGDLHRHTDLSRCAGRKDGTLLDAIRYAHGPGKLSFLAITDHFQHLTPWSFWRQLRDIERWDAPGRLALLPGVERMVTDLGHQNLVFSSLQDARAAGRNRLPEDLQVGTVVAIPHMTSLPRNPFDWKRWNAEVQRLVEVHQGRRGSFEGLPRQTVAAVENARASNPKGQNKQAGAKSQSKRQGEPTWPHAAFPAQAKVGWLTHLPAAIEAHEIPPGVISSSDHASSGTGFAGIMWRDANTKAISRDTVFQALLQRQTFATTGPNFQQTQPHYVEIQVLTNGKGDRQLQVRADSQQIAAVTIFENGAIWKVEQQPAKPTLPNNFMVRTHFGRGFAWNLNIAAQGLKLTGTSLRQPRPDLFGAPKVEKDGSVQLHFPADVSYAADVDLILRAIPQGESTQILQLEYQSSVAGATARSMSVDLSKLQTNLARRFWLKKKGKTPYFEVQALTTAVDSGQPTSNEYELLVPLAGRPESAIYYARVAWIDGNFAWSRLIR